MFDENQEEMSLRNIGKGAIIEKFDDALARVIRDIQNINTSEKFRTITITAKIGPVNDARTLIGLDIGSPNIKFPAGKSFVTQAMITINSEGKPVAKEISQEQNQLPFKKRVVEGSFGQKQ